MGQTEVQEDHRAQVATSFLLGRAAVLGAGAMGSRIAAHLSNAGVPVVLLDVPAQQGPRNGVAAGAIAALLKAKPAAFYDVANAGRITAGNFDDDLALLKDCDWVIEAVTENLAIKQSLLEKIAPHLKPDALVTTNTSGLPVVSIAAKMDAGFRRRWFGTHFFNPPRYMRLVEVIPTAESDPALVGALAQIVDRRLGKTVVMARDTPNFIANRIGTFAMLTAVRLMQEQGLTIEEVDALTGSVIGWPRTGTFRLADMVGLDVLAHVARNFAAAKAAAGEADAGAVDLPPFLVTMLERGWLGDKAGQGFYKKDPAVTDPKKNRLALDWQTLEYRPAERPKFPAIEMAKNAETVAERLKLIANGDTDRDKAGIFLFALLTAIWNYTADVLPEIADSAAEVDRAMRAGFNWELGPFEMWDAAGVAATAAKMRARGLPVSAQAEALLDAGEQSWYREDSALRLVFDPAAKVYRSIEVPDGVASAAVFRRAGKVVRKNPGCSLLDIGEGIALLELHSKKNAIGGDILTLITQTLSPGSEAVRNFRGFVISGDASDFSVGANLMQLLLSIQEGEWDEVDGMIRAFQRMTSAIKFCPRPVVAAPFGMTLGGGAEISLHAARRHPHAELYMGLVESGVGLVPGGGGTKEMALHAADAAQAASGLDPVTAPARFAISADLQDALRQRFETVAMAKVSTSAAEARGLDLLSVKDAVSLNRERLLLDARETAIGLAEAGYAAPFLRSIPAAGESVLATLKLGVYLMRQAEYISDHDVKVAGHIARILCGGAVTPGVMVTEQQLLDLEREAFLSLCGERRTQERIAYTLQNGKPLRN
ncbi:3-hydroxyacyl-CoA dehydrogenase/enoyl-CoA hydratase family protein [Silvibacterium dinghuense]|uniref:3-hydroxyacyl-CoA dehydrogenase/enoyl-CoA hydratase family protein n=1 Tax=Silvibacterium dinghuense TaxID=1560006 RepID=A0A4Q1SKS8_9BACT|nr:3-hydroxyacyl-CoA dehydrogenase NAD-binding domain-containing protein [Silvibacterium dinghuense]RXS98087.1 3-hydroxyacyl-CoA dehydrogenase/enoyl-CoA hydratase family protein [Silvibacterium dinghuense]GGG92491.1 3-hydroxyacyl-CoA dehydrogenase [Silvibacterium dinghuense]